MAIKEEVLERLSKALKLPEQNDPEASKVQERRIDKAENAFMKGDYDYTIQLLELLGC